MRLFVFVACLAAVAVAHPDVGGYNYNNNGLQQQQQQPPQQQHLLQPQPAQHGLSQNGHLVQPHVHQQLPAEHSFANFGPQMIYAAPNAAPVADHLAAPIMAEEMLSSQQDSYNQAYQQSSLPHDSGYAYAPMQTKIHKHIYVHVPPKDFEDDDAIETRVHHQMGPKQKHYKIVFIKAPAPPMLRAPIIAPPPQNEEKTLIYVLHKKPDGAQDIIIPTPAPTKPSKPEVYFIKYKTKKEEAPVYGPPPAIDMEPRHIEHPSMEYGAPSLNAATAAEEHLPEVSAPFSTIQPAVDEPAPQQFVSEVPAEVYAAPTMAAIHVEDFQTTLGAAAVAPSAGPTLNAQYLAPETTQSIAEPQHMPSASYGPPGRFFIKKKK